MELETSNAIQSTAGAIPIRNEKGAVTMQKVKVQRYIAGKRPEFAHHSSSDSEGEEERRRGGEDMPFRRTATHAGRQPMAAAEAPQMQHRHQQHHHQQRRHHEPAAVLPSSSDSEDEKTRARARAKQRKQQQQRRGRESSSSTSPSSSSSESSSDERSKKKKTQTVKKSVILPVGDDEGEDDDEGLDDDKLHQKRMMLKQKVRAQQQREEELLKKEVEESGEEGENESEYTEEEYTDEESDEEVQARLKPVFVGKRDRITLQDAEQQEKKMHDLQLQEKRAAEDRKRQSVKMVEGLIRDEMVKEANKAAQTGAGTIDLERFDLATVITDDENEELQYEAWKVRELKRIKKRKEERETRDKEQLEIDKIHNMTEEERRNYLRANPKLVTNKAVKGKYKFLQKYYHRGAFFLDKDDGVYQRDFAQPTLEDHFDKTVLPTAMQVKNFGMAGRTKYTHLVDQDTTDFNSAWTSETAQNLKFSTKHAAGMRDVFDRPQKKRKT